MLATLRSALVWRGILAVIVGVIAIAWPDITVGAFVILFAVYAFLAGITELAAAFRSNGAGQVFGHIALAVITIAAGVIALVWPDMTALVLTTFIAIWALIAGVIEIAMAFGSGQTAGERAMWALGGLIPLLLGIALLIRPDVGALALATVYGFFSLVYGFTSLTAAAQAKSFEKAAARLGAPA